MRKLILLYFLAVFLPTAHGQQRNFDRLVLGPTEALNLTRAMQESIQNILKHAEATRITVAISSEADLLCLTVSDNGKGFVVENHEGEHYGIENMKKRLKDTDGHLEIRSIAGEGTTVHISIPLSTPVEI